MAASAPSVGPNRLYVGNLPIGASSELLRNVFVQFGPLSFVEIKDKAGSHFAYVQLLKNHENHSMSYLLQI